MELPARMNEAQRKDDPRMTFRRESSFCGPILEAMAPTGM
jgi:hypothetical protein